MVKNQNVYIYNGDNYKLTKQMFSHFINNYFCFFFGINQNQIPFLDNEQHNKTILLNINNNIFIFNKSQNEIIQYNNISNNGKNFTFKILKNNNNIKIIKNNLLNLLIPIGFDILVDFNV